MKTSSALRIRFNAFDFTALALIGIAFQACGDGSQDTTDVNADTSYTYSLNLKVQDPSKLPARLQPIYNGIVAKKPVSYSEVGNILIQDQVVAYRQTRKEELKADDEKSLKAYVDELVKSPSDGLTLKEAYEKHIESKGTPLTYQKDAVTLMDIKEKIQMQCYSGTMLNHIVTRRAVRLDSLLKSNPVVIFTEGHVQPGNMVKDGAGNWALNGVETTASGPAQVEFGPAKDLEGDILVVDAQLFEIVEVFKNYLSNADEAVSDALEQTAKKYGIQLSKANADSLKSVKNQKVFTAKSANSTPFAFGIPEDVGDKPLSRNRMEKLNRSGAPVKRVNQLTQVVKLDEQRPRNDYMERIPGEYLGVRQEIQDLGSAITKVTITGSLLKIRTDIIPIAGRLDSADVENPTSIEIRYEVSEATINDSTVEFALTLRSAEISPSLEGFLKAQNEELLTRIQTSLDQIRGVKQISWTARYTRDDKNEATALFFHQDVYSDRIQDDWFLPNGSAMNRIFPREEN